MTGKWGHIVSMRFFFTSPRDVSVNTSLLNMYNHPLIWSYAFLNLRSANDRQMSDRDGRDHRRNNEFTRS